MDSWIGETVVTTEPLMVRRTVAGDIELELLPRGSVCTVVCFDDAPRTYILADENGDELWLVVEDQFRKADAS